MNFPYPDRRTSQEELERDILYRKIPSDIREVISDRAWQTGADAARQLVNEHGANMPISRIASASGLSIKREHKDNVAANVRYFSEYYSGRSQIILYIKSIELWAKKNSLSLQEAEELILAHEYYHFLECTKLGLTHKQYMVPTLQIGSFVILRSGIRALSEIGAHGFARTYYELTRKSIWKGKKTIAPLINHATNQMSFDGKRMAEKIFTGKFFNITGR